MRTHALLRALALFLIAPLAAGQSLLDDPQWFEEGDQASASFGRALASAGDVNADGYSDVLVGAPEFDNGEVDEGKALLYLGSIDGLSSTPAWSAEGGQAGARFGSSVALAGDVNGDGFSDVLIGAPGFTNGQLEEGAAYVFLGSASGLAATAAWAVESDQATGGQNHPTDFAAVVSAAGDVNGDGYSDVLVGAPGFDNGQRDEGRVFLYLGSAQGLELAPAWMAESDQADAAYGRAVSAAGDVNHDGFGDVLVGAEEFDGGAAGEGLAHVFLGSASGLAALPAWSAEGSLALARFGSAVASGDVNGDGFDDVLVGARTLSNGATNEGAVYFFPGSATGPTDLPSWVVEGGAASASFGTSVALGDVNGDAFDDVLVGGLELARAFRGTAAGPESLPSWAASTPQTDSRFGSAIALAGDPDGDGFGDVLVGAEGFDGNLSGEGRAYLYEGGPPNGVHGPAWTLEGNLAGAYFPTSISSRGDVNGDGYGDVVFGGTDDGLTGGRALLFLGSAAGFAASESWRVDGVAEGLGHSVAMAGDLNGDGYDDVVVGAPGYTNGQTREGRALVFLGSATGLSTAPAWTFEGNETIANFGYSVSGAGDVNGDGYAELLIGAPGFDVNSEGRVFLFAGSRTGPSLLPTWSSEGSVPHSAYVSARIGASVAGVGDVDGDGFGDFAFSAPGYSDYAPADPCCNDCPDCDPCDPCAFGRSFLFRGSPSGPTPDHRVLWLGDDVLGAGDLNGDGLADLITLERGGSSAYWTMAVAVQFGPPPHGRWRVHSPSSFAGGLVWVAPGGDFDGDGFGDVIIGRPWGDFDSSTRDYSYIASVSLLRGSAAGLITTPAWTLSTGVSDFDLNFGWGVVAGDVNGDGFSDLLIGEVSHDGGQTDEGRVELYTANPSGGGLLQKCQQRRATDARPIAIQGLLADNGLFRIQAEFPANGAGASWARPGAVLVHLEWEVKPAGVPFDGLGIESGAPVPLGAAGLVLNELVQAREHGGTGRLAGRDLRGYAWRARLVTNHPLVPRTAWFTAPGASITEAKLHKRLPWR